jgi:hypothetical protein
MNARKEEIERLAREIEAEAEEEKARTARLTDKYITREGKPPVDDEVDRLSDLSDVDYEQERKAAASALGVRVSALDKFVAAVKGARTEALVPDPEPWARSCPR